MAGTDNAYCKLVIEVDLDKENTESQLNQVSYKIVKSASGYPNLTQTDIVANNSGIYQYELARFKTNTNGITDFEDKRTYLDFATIYSQIETEYRAILQELENELAKVKDGSAYIFKENIATLTGTIEMPEEGKELEGSIDLDYPTGFDNTCYVISILSHNSVHPDWWATPQETSLASSIMVLGNGNIRVTLKPDKITVTARKNSTDQPRNDIVFRVMLMKT